MIRLRVTVSGEYDASPSHYGPSDPAGIAAEELAVFRGDPREAVDAMEAQTVTVEPVEGIERLWVAYPWPAALHSGPIVLEDIAQADELRGRGWSVDGPYIREAKYTSQGTI